MRKSGKRFPGVAVRTALAVGLAVFLGACASAGQTDEERAAKVVEERVLKRWDLLSRGQFEGAYGFFSPTSRSVVPLDAFVKRSGGVRWWRSMKVQKVDCRADTCQVTMVVEYDLKELKGLSRTVEETWVKDSGEWWLVAKN